MRIAGVRCGATVDGAAWAKLRGGDARLTDAAPKVPGAPRLKFVAALGARDGAAWAKLRPGDGRLTDAAPKAPDAPRLALVTARGEPLVVAACPVLR